MTDITFLQGCKSIAQVQDRISLIEDMLQFSTHVFISKYGETQPEVAAASKHLKLLVDNAFRKALRYVPSREVPRSKQTEETPLVALPGTLAELFSRICVAEDHFNLYLPVEYDTEFKSFLNTKGIEVHLAKTLAVPASTDSLAHMMHVARMNYDRAVSQYIVLQTVMALVGEGRDNENVFQVLTTKALMTIRGIQTVLLSSSSLVALNSNPQVKYTEQEVLLAKENVAKCAQATFGRPGRYVQLAVMHHLTVDGYHPGRYLRAEEDNLRSAIDSAIEGLK